MGYTTNKHYFFSLLLLSLSTLLWLSVAQIELPQQQFWGSLQRQQQHRLRAKTSCNIQQLRAHEPSYRFQSEAGVSEHWSTNNEDFECAGIEFVRHEIQPKGLLLPSYSNAPQLVYIVQGSGIQGTVIPGCAETYESGYSSSSSSSQERGQQGEEEERGSSSSRQDRHQKLRRFKRGDVVAVPPGFTNWWYNDGDSPLVKVSILDVGSDINQLDLKVRKFFLAGNLRQGESQGEQQRERRHRRSEGEQGQEQEQGEGEIHSVFYGFDDQLLSDTLNIEPELVRKLKGQEDNRGEIVHAENLKLILPQWEREERERQEGGGGRRGSREEAGGDNGLEETFCSFKIRQNIDNPSRADVYNPRGGRIATVNGQSLPILSYLRLSAERGVLYRDAITAPRWTVNAHTALYVTRGRARIQVVGGSGRPVFDGEVNENQLLIVPQDFVVIKKAAEDGFEWISFKTNDNAVHSHLAGRLSAIRAMPEEVVMNSYGVSREDARRLKYSREEVTLFSPRQSSKSRGGAGGGEKYA